MTCLTLIATDAITKIIDYTNACDIGKLFICGDKTLNRHLMVLGGLSGVIIRLLPTHKKLPTFVHHSKVKHLRLESFCDDDNFDSRLVPFLSNLPNSLVSLIIESAHLFDAFNKNTDFLMPSLPHLTCLKICDFYAHFQNFPIKTISELLKNSPSLTTLSLRTMPASVLVFVSSLTNLTSLEFHFLNCIGSSKLPALPQSITNLKFNDIDSATFQCLIGFQPRLALQNLKLFMTLNDQILRNAIVGMTLKQCPSIIKLQLLQVTANEELFKNLPIYLAHLALHRIDCDIITMLSLLPSSLTYLQCKTLYAIAPKNGEDVSFYLPPKLTNLDSFMMQHVYTYGSFIPKSIKQIQLFLRHSPKDIILTNSSVTTLTTPSTPNLKMPATLTCLNLEMTRSIPPDQDVFTNLTNLKTLKISYITNCEFLRKLPASITQLNLSSSRLSQYYLPTEVLSYFSHLKNCHYLSVNELEVKSFSDLSFDELPPHLIEFNFFIHVVPEIEYDKTSGNELKVRLTKLRDRLATLKLSGDAIIDSLL